MDTSFLYPDFGKYTLVVFWPTTKLNLNHQRLMAIIKNKLKVKIKYINFYLSSKECSSKLGVCYLPLDSF